MVYVIFFSAVHTDDESNHTRWDVTCQSKATGMKAAENMTFMWKSKKSLPVSLDNLTLFRWRIVDDNALIDYKPKLHCRLTPRLRHRQLYIVLFFIVSTIRGD